MLRRQIKRLAQAGTERLVKRAAPWLMTPEWEMWLVDALVDGRSPSELSDDLTGRGVPVALAQGILQELVARPALQRAIAEARQRRALEQIVGLRRTLERLRHEGIARIDKPEADHFYQRYVCGNEPVVLRDAARDWPALETWSFDHLRARFGQAEVEVCVDRDEMMRPDPNWKALRRTMTMSAFLDALESLESPSNDLYMISNNRNIERDTLAGLLDDVHLDATYVLADQVTRGAALWIGPAGTITPMHHDTCNILFHQIRGSKAIDLISPLETAMLQGGELRYYNRHERSGALDVPAHRVELQPGEALFIPVGWWHRVEALEPSVNLALTCLRFPNNIYDWYAPGDL